jgi:23S rRNA G2445 N2-methylase RlmL
VHTLLVECEPGLSELQLTEIRGLGYRGSVDNPLTVRVEDAQDCDVVRLNFLLRQATGVFIELWHGTVHGLDSIRDAAAVPDYAEWLQSGQTFRVQARRFGEHEFFSPEIAGAVGQVVVEQVSQRHGSRLRADLEGADVTLHAQLYDGRLAISVDTSGTNLSERHPRSYQHPASLRPSIAAAMLELCSFGTGKALLDPMAGGGTVLTEACFIRNGIPAGRFQECFAFQRIAHLDSSLLPALRQQTDESSQPCSDRIGGCDRSTNALAGMRRNFAAQGIAAQIHVWEADAARLDRADIEGYEVLVSNPPFGLRSGRLAEVRKTYERVPMLAAQAGVSQIVMITPNDDWLIESAEAAGYELTDLVPFMHGDLDNRMIRLVWPI